MRAKAKFLSVVVAMAMAASMGTAAFAASPDLTNDTPGGAVPVDNGTEVWAGIAVDEPDARIRVEVPTLFAFVVNGSVDTTAGGTAVDTDEDGVILPNVKVTDAQDGKYKISTVGDPAMAFSNYSTMLDGENRVGMKVVVNGSIRNEGDEKSRNGWTHVDTDGMNDWSSAGKHVKEYQITVDSKPFAANDDGSFSMKDGIELEAPDATGNNVDSTTQLAKVPFVKNVTFDVKVGGTRGDYKTAENSAKVGTIVWTVSTPEFGTNNT